MAISGSSTIHTVGAATFGGTLAVSGAITGDGSGITGVTAITATALSGTTAQLTTGVETSGYLKVSGASTFTGDLIATCDTVRIQSAESTDPVLILKNTNTDANSARLRFVKDAGEAGSNNDKVGLIEFYGDDANQDQVLFAQIEGAVEVAANGQEGGKLTLGVAAHDGEMNVGLLLVDGDAEDEIDVIVGNTTTSLTHVAGVLKVGGNVIQASDGGSTITMDTSDNITIGGAVQATFFSGSSGLVIDGASTLGGTLSITGAVSGANTLHAVGVATFGNTVAATGSVTAVGLTSTGPISGSNVLHAVGVATFGNSIASTGSITSGGSFIIGSADLNETDLEKLDGITDGAGAANKALVLNGDADIATGLRSVTGSGDARFANIHATQFYGGGGGLTGVTATVTALSGTTAQLTTGVETSGYLKVSGASTFAGDITANCDTVTIQSAESTDPVLILKNTNTDANGARLRFVKDAGEAGSNADVSGLIEFYADDANQDQVLFAQIKGSVEQATNGQEGGKISLAVATHDGELQEGLVLIDGDAEDEIDVIIGNTNTSLTTVQGVLKVGGNVIQASDGGTTITMDTSDNVTIAGAVQATFFSGSTGLVIDGASTLGGTLFVTGAVSGASTLQAVGAAVLGNTLAVSGAVTLANDITVGGGDIVYGSGQAATLSIADGAGTNIAGRDLTISAGNGTGNGAPGLMRLKVPKPGAGGSSVHTSVTIVECLPEGVNTHWNQIHNSADDTGLGDIVYFGTGTTVAGKTYYLHTSSVWFAADAAVAVSGSDTLLGMAIGTNPAANGMIVRGFFDVNTYLTGTFKAGRAIYASTASGYITTDRPSGSGEFVRILGHSSATAKVVYFNPSVDWVELT